MTPTQFLYRAILQKTSIKRDKVIYIHGDLPAKYTRDGGGVNSAIRLIQSSLEQSTRMSEGNRPRRHCVARKVAAPSAVHYVGYVEDEETPEMIMKKFEELEKVLEDFAYSCNSVSRPYTCYCAPGDHLDQYCA